MKQLIYIFALWFCFTLGGCENKEYLYCDESSRIWLGLYDTIGNLIYFRDSVQFSFMLSDNGLAEDTLYIMAHVTGLSAAQDRPFRLEVIEEETNVSDSYYRLGDPVVPANALEAAVPVIVSKNIPGLNLREESARVAFRFVPNEYFLAGEYDLTYFKVVWCNFLTIPDTWTYWITSHLGPFSQARYKFIIDHTGIMDFSRYEFNSGATTALVAKLREYLAGYNADPANRDREEGWPYKDDDGSDLKF